MPPYALAGALLLAALLAYLSARAAFIPITHDEAATLLHLFGENYSHLLTYTYQHTYMSANNHVLNTVLAKACVEVIGPGLYSLRLPNVLSGLLYAVAGIVFARNLFASLPARLAALTVWVANPCLLEFFSLARGYGMGAALEGTALVCGWTYLTTPDRSGRRSRWFTASCAFAAASVLANFTFLNFLPVFCLLWALQWMSESRRTAFFHALQLIGFSGLAVFCAYGPLQKIRRSGDLGMYGQQDFWHDTVFSFVKVWMPGLPAWGTVAIALALAACTLAALLVAVSAFRRNGWQVDGQVWITALLPGTVLCNLLLHTLTGASFLITRTTLLFYPLLAAALLGLFRAWPASGWKTAAAAVSVAGLCLNLALHVNVSFSAEWAYDRDVFKVLSIVRAAFESEKPDKPYILYAHAYLQPALEAQAHGLPGYPQGMLEPVRDVSRWEKLAIDTAAQFYYMDSSSRAVFDPSFVVAYTSADAARLLFRKK